MPFQKISALADGQRTDVVDPECVVNADGAGQAELHRMLGTELLADGARGVVQQNVSSVHQQHLIGDGEHLLQPVLDQQDGQPQLAVELPKRCDEVGSGDGVKLAGRLVKKEQPRLPSPITEAEVQKLLLARRKTAFRIAAKQAPGCRK